MAVSTPTDTIPQTPKLTGKQKVFADSYIETLNGTEACRRAGYKGDDRQLAVISSQNLRKLNVLTYINERLNEFAMSASEILVQLTDIARGDIRDAMNNIGGVDPLEAVRRGKSHLIKRFKTKTTIVSGRGEDDGMEIHETEIELYDRLKALELLGKYHAIFKERIQADIHDYRSQIAEQGVNPDIYLAQQEQLSKLSIEEFSRLIELAAEKGDTT